MVARGWSPSEEQRYGFYLVVGLLLVLNPFAVHWFGLGATTYEYAARPVELDGEELTYPDSDVFLDRSRVEGVDCYLLERPWTCYLEERVAENGSVTVDPERSYDRRPRDEFVFLDDGFYRRSVGDAPGEDAVTVSYERVTDRTAVEAVADPVGRAPGPLARAARNGRATAREQVEAVYFVRTGGGYYLVGHAGTDRGVEGRWTFSLAGCLVGLLVLRRRHRFRDGD